VTNSGRTLRAIVMTATVVLALPVANPAARWAMRATAVTQIPLCDGLTIVTSVNNAAGDFESIKRVTRVDSARVDIAYSAEVPRPDGGVEHLAQVRSVRRSDLRDAHLYHWNFSGDREIPGSTAIGVSTAVLDDLRNAGQTELSVPAGVEPGVLTGPLLRVEPTAVPYDVIVNDERTTLSAIHARGRLGRWEFWILDDPADPLALQWTLGGTGVRLTVVRIAFPIDRPSEKIARTLATGGRAVVYGIYFDFGSDHLKPESDVVLAEIAGVLEAHPAWSLAIEGHTDNIGGESYNLDLSRRRAAAVKRALADRYHVDSGRLRADGFGASRPKDTNETLAGRARNRRVELVKVG